MAGGGGQGANVPQGGQPSSRQGAKGIAMQPVGQVSPEYLQSVYAAMQSAGRIGGGQAGGQFMPGAPNAQMYNTRPMPMAPAQGQTTQIPGYANGGFVDPGFMQYQGQGQPNQPNALPPTQPMAGPDGGGDYAPANMGFDNSGSDGGVGGQPTMMQTPLSGNSPVANIAQQGTKPLGLGQFQQPQGLQIAGNPTSQVVQRPQQR